MNLMVILLSLIDSHGHVKLSDFGSSKVIFSVSDCEVKEHFYEMNLLLSISGFDNATFNVGHIFSS